MAHHRIKTYADGHKQVPYCSVCSAEDTELPCDCPGEAMTQIQKRAVALGDLDFISGDWITKANAVTMSVGNANR